jgi:Tfp pilus assembly pilus retraction ATPase PilT
LPEGDSNFEVSGRLNSWLETLVQKSGSDLYLVEGLPPTIRVASRLLQISSDNLDGDAIESAILPALRPSAAQSFRSGASSIDASMQVRRLGRFRINLHRERGRAAVTIRALPARPPRLSELGLRPISKR